MKQVGVEFSRSTRPFLREHSEFSPRGTEYLGRMHAEAELKGKESPGVGLYKMRGMMGTQVGCYAHAPVWPDYSFVDGIYET